MIDISPLLTQSPDEPVTAAYAEVASQLDLCCRDLGFFYISGHGIPPERLDELQACARSFFAQPLAEKQKMAMLSGGRAWRGYFPLGDELTSGIPDNKEGIYFGSELPLSAPEVQQEWPMHGPNLWPEHFAVHGALPMKRVVLDHLAALTHLAQLLLGALAHALGLDRGYFAQRFTENPTTLFRIFNYPLPPEKNSDEGENSDESDCWGVREHTDYGFLTLLLQDLDGRGGLEVLTRGGEWIQAPPVAHTFVVNLGDMLELWTHGLYRATPHRVRYPPLPCAGMQPPSGDRLSFPFFFDPNWRASLEPIEALREEGERAKRSTEGVYVRWDKLDLQAMPRSIYGDFLWSKVSKCFPHLATLAPSLPPTAL